MLAMHDSGKFELHNPTSDDMNTVMLDDGKRERLPLDELCLHELPSARTVPPPAAPRDSEAVPLRLPWADGADPLVNALANCLRI